MKIKKSQLQQLIKEIILNEFVSTFSRGQRVKTQAKLKQVGWKHEVPAGAQGTIMDKKSEPFGVVTYIVRWDNGDTVPVGNAHLLLTKI
jgi:hypothetical protein